jgi:acyl-CoA thioester hydrolase
MDGSMSEFITSTSINAKGAVNETRIRVRYAETDQMGIVYHSNHFIWFEVGRVELLRQLGFSYKEMEKEDDCFIAVVDARCRYKAPVHYDDEVVVRTYLKNIREKMIHFGYELVRADSGELLAEGETTHIVANSQMQPRVLPAKYLKAFRAAIGGVRAANSEQPTTDDQRPTTSTENRELRTALESPAHQRKRSHA